jgi:hypothetical protein
MLHSRRSNKRNRNDLDFHVHDSRHSDNTVDRSYYAKRQLWTSESKKERAHLHALNAVQASHTASEIQTADAVYEFVDSCEGDDDISISSSRASLSSEMQTKRREAICYLFSYIYGSPPREKWKRLNLVLDIMNRLNIPRESYSKVVHVLEDVLSQESEGGIYDPQSRKRLSGRRSIIVDDTPEANIIYSSLESGVSITSATCLVNQYRRGRKDPLPPVSWSAVEAFTLRSPSIIKQRRLTKKSGKEDQDSTWAQARVSQCRQFLAQYKLGLQLYFGIFDCIPFAPHISSSFSE